MVHHGTKPLPRAPKTASPRPHVPGHFAIIASPSSIYCCQCGVSGRIVGTAAHFGITAILPSSVLLLVAKLMVQQPAAASTESTNVGNQVLGFWQRSNCKPPKACCDVRAILCMQQMGTRVSFWSQIIMCACVRGSPGLEVCFLLKCFPSL